MTENARNFPGPNAVKLLEERNNFIPKGVSNIAPLFIDHAMGAKVIDVDGNEYIDFIAGIGVLNIGSCSPRVVQAITDQAAKYSHFCFHIAMYEPYVKVARELCQLHPGDYAKKAMLANSGAEAVENAIKICRKANKRPAIIAFENAFHGRTNLTMALTSKVNPFKLDFGPFTPEVYRLPYAYCYRCNFGQQYPNCEMQCLQYIEKLLAVDLDPKSITCMIVEPVQGEGGIIVPPSEFIQGLKKICEKYEMIYLGDEIQTGFGRTGKFLASENFGIVPDIVTLAKSIGAGLPLSAVVGKAELMDSVHPGGIGGTYGGNPIACAASIEVINILKEEKLMDKAVRIGAIMKEKLNELKDKYTYIGDVRNLGAIGGIEIVQDRATKEPAKELAARVVSNCIQSGLIVANAGIYGNVIRMLPPLVIEDTKLEEGFAILDMAFEKAL